MAGAALELECASLVLALTALVLAFAALTALAFAGAGRTAIVLTCDLLISRQFWDLHVS